MQNHHSVFSVHIKRVLVSKSESNYSTKNKLLINDFLHANTKVLKARCWLNVIFFFIEGIHLLFWLELNFRDCRSQMGLVSVVLLTSFINKAVLTPTNTILYLSFTCVWWEVFINVVWLKIMNQGALTLNLDGYFFYISIFQ